MVLSYDDNWGKVLRLKFKIKNDSCDEYSDYILKQCNNIKNNIEKFLSDNPDCFLITENYRIFLYFTYDKTFNGITICNFESENDFYNSNLCVLGSGISNFYGLCKYFDNIKIIETSIVYDDEIKYLKEMDSLEKINLKSTSKEQLELFKKEVPNCEVDYIELVERLY